MDFAEKGKNSSIESERTVGERQKLILNLGYRNTTQIKVTTLNLN